MSDTNPMHQQLLGHLLGALDDEEQDWVEARLQDDEEYRRTWVELRRKMAPVMAARPDFEPPPGLADRTCRLVASFAPVARRAKPRRHGMSADWAFPGRSARVSWLDLTAVALVLVVVGVLVPPAIYASRFQSRLATCQDGLRQVGQAIDQYGYRHGSDLLMYADNERLTIAGRMVAELLDEQLAPDDGRTVCPDAWLATQGDLHWSRRAALATWLGNIDHAMPEVSEVGPTWASAAWVNTATTSEPDWSGTSRNGTFIGETDLPPAAVAILADAPSADLPGQTLDCHSGQGRNMFFEDGHVDFLPCSTPRESADAILSQDDLPAVPRVTVPVSFVGWH
jgi:hypothetical protein